MGEHTLEIKVGTVQRQFKVEMALDELGHESDWPTSIEGKFLNITVEELVTLRFGSERVTATIRAKRYKFDHLEKDGTFILKRDFQ